MVGQVVGQAFLFDSCDLTGTTMPSETPRGCSLLFLRCGLLSQAVVLLRMIPGHLWNPELSCPCLWVGPVEGVDFSLECDMLSVGLHLRSSFGAHPGCSAVHRQIHPPVIKDFEWIHRQVDPLGVSKLGTKVSS